MLSTGLLRNTACSVVAGDRDARISVATAAKVEAYLAYLYTNDAIKAESAGKYESAADDWASASFFYYRAMRLYKRLGNEGRVAFNERGVETAFLAIQESIASTRTGTVSRIALPQVIHLHKC